MYVNSMWIDKHSNFIQNLKQIQIVWKQREMYFGSDDSYAVPSVKNWRGCQSLSLLSVSKKNERKTKKMNVLLGFEPFLLSSSEAKWRVAVPMPQV